MIYDPEFDGEHPYGAIQRPRGKNRLLVVWWDMLRFGDAIVSASRAGWKPRFELVLDCESSWYVPGRPLSRHKGCGLFGSFNWDPHAALLMDNKFRPAQVAKNARGECVRPARYGKMLSSVETLNYATWGKAHPHEKPAAHTAAVLRGAGSVNVLDLFAGSGAAGVASIMAGCAHYRGYETDESVASGANARIAEARAPALAAMELDFSEEA